MIAAYYRLAKPGIVYGNVFSTIAGFLFASHLSFGLAPFFASIFGMGFVIASACVFNNMLDRRIDAHMSRTKNRALVTGAISMPAAFAYGCVLGAAGFAILFFHVNAATGYVALFGFAVYIALYGYFKRVSNIGTVIGSFAGAAPMLAGYTASAGHVDAAGLLLFAAMVAWQMPHFYAIAIYRLDEYAAAGIPVLPKTHGTRIAKLHILVYAVLFLAAELSLYLCGYAGIVYAIAVTLAWLWWFARIIRGFHAADERAWGKSVFLGSLTVLLVFCFAISFAPVLP